MNVVEKYFEEYALVGQDILGSPERWDKVLALVPEDILPAAARGPGEGPRRGRGLAVAVISLNRRAQHREQLQGDFPKKRDSVQRWELLKGRMERTRVSSQGAVIG